MKNRKKHLILAALLFIFLCSSCSFIPPAKLPQKTAAKPVLVEDFEKMFPGDSVDPVGTEEIFLKGSKFEADGWVIAQGETDAKKWVVSVAGEGHRSKRSVLLEWNNKNETWLTFAIWFWEPQKFPDGEEIRFYVKPDTQVKFDVTLRINDSISGQQPAFSAMTPRIIPTGDWQQIVVPFYKMAIPDWFIEEEMGGKEPRLKSIPPYPDIAMVNISPVWNSEGKCLVDDVEIGVLSKKKKKIEYRERKKWLETEKFVCYYGSDAIHEMSDFDVAVIESGSHRKNDIELLKKAGAWVVGYVTVGEDDKLTKADGKGPGGSASFYMDVDWDGKPDRNENWGSYFVDAGNPLWQDIIINKRVKGVLDKGCDGIFMDTVDTAEMYPDTKEGMISLIKKIRDTYPDIKIVQNRGFVVLKGTSPYIDAIMYEDFSSHYDWDNDTYSKAEKANLVSSGVLAVDINKARQEHNFLVLALDYADLNQKDLIQFCYDRSWEYDFIPYVSTINLDEVYPYYSPKSERGVKKLQGEKFKIGVEEDVSRLKEEINGVKAKKDKKNIALKYNDAKVRADSIFGSEYNPIKAIDGITNDKRLPWQEAAWASLELFIDHWLEIEFAEPRKISRVKIYWTYDNRRYYNSKEVEVQYYSQDSWKKLDIITTDKDNVPVSELKIEKPETAKKVRIFQNKGNGPRSRPNLMWIGEIEIYSE